ncbi:unnamed protein product [Rotaria socialis]|uniref:LisH domain-containing protein n=1 Tax=Rotaria socialis TaxID=392032 RepID=A0A821TIT9_9BILA|nr:unnamed protein product [Rotaria socialis]
MAEATLNYQTIRTTHAAREADDLRVENRKKNLIILVLQWLAEEGYVESARQLEHETNLDVTKYDVCDNIDLDTILQEYESYFYIKFNKYPKLTKKNVSTGKLILFAFIIQPKRTNGVREVRTRNGIMIEFPQGIDKQLVSLKKPIFPFVRKQSYDRFGRI